MKSETLRNSYKEWQTTATAKQLEFADTVYEWAEAHYSVGGDTIVECYAPDEICEDFANLDEVKQCCGLQVEQALNTRWGEDDDPQLKRYTLKQAIEAMEGSGIDVRAIIMEETQKLQAIIDKHLHIRRCWECGEEFYTASAIVPGCLCPKCGSQDTRRMRNETAQFGDTP